MNRSIRCLLVLFLFAGAVRGQDVSLCNQVLSAAGKTAVEQGNSWAWTVGEPVIFTLGPVADRILTQGFHQSDLCLPAVSTNDASLADWHIEVFPNPTADVLHVRFSAEKTGALTAAVFDMLGRVVLANALLDSPDDAVIDCSAWLPGVYLLHLQDRDTRAATIVRFVRL